MKRLLLILILTFSFQSWTKADDISDFQIEGMSIGDSLLDYISESEIKKNKKNWFKNKKYSISTFRNVSNFSNFYDEIQIIFKTKDKNKNIEGIEANKDFVNNMEGCLKELHNVRKIVSDLFEGGNVIESEIKTFTHNGNPNIEITTVDFIFKSDDKILIQCSDDKTDQYIDGIRLSVRTKKYEYFLNYEAYK